MFSLRFFNFKTGLFDPQHKRQVNHWSLISSQCHSVFLSHLPPQIPKPVVADGHPSPSLVLQDVSFCYKDVFPSYCYQVLAHRGSSDC